MRIKITKDETDRSIRYHIKVNKRSKEGFGTLGRYDADKTEVGINLGLKEGDIVSIIEDFFPNGYCSYPYYPNGRDETKMRRGVGSVLLTEMIKDAREKFSAKKIVALNCSNSLIAFLLKQSFTKIGCMDRSYCLPIYGGSRC